MYLCTVLRSSPTWRAIADTLPPCRCNSRIITISPSPTNDAPLRMERHHHRPPATDSLPQAPSQTHLGKFNWHILGVPQPGPTGEM